MPKRAPSRRVSRRGKAGRPDAGARRPDVGPSRPDFGPSGPGRRPRAPVVFASDIVLKLPCDTFTCTKLEITEWKEHATTAHVTSVKDSTGTNVANPLRQQLLDAVFAPTGPGDTPEKRWPKKYTFDTCPAGCTCPPDGTTWGPVQDADQEVQVPVEGSAAGATQTYTVTVKLKVKRKIGTAKCV